MSWKRLLAARKIHLHQSSKQELDDLPAIIRRDLSDASIPVRSEDRKFATAYNAAYTGVQIATSTEAAEILHRPQEFSALVEKWIKATHPQLG